MCPRDGFVVIRVRAITLSVIAVQLVILKVGITFPYEGDGFVVIQVRICALETALW